MVKARARLGTKRCSIVAGKVLAAWCAHPIVYSINEWVRKILRLPALGVPTSYTKEQIKAIADRLKDDMKNDSPYDVMGIKPSMPVDDIKVVYLALARKYSEVGKTPNPRRVAELNAAYEEILKEKGVSP